MFKKIKAQMAANRHFDQQWAEMAFLLGGLTWLENKDAVVRLHDGTAEVEIFHTVDGTRVRRAVGNGESLADAIKEAADIIDAQDGVEQPSIK